MVPPNCPIMETRGSVTSNSAGTGGSRRWRGARQAEKAAQQSLPPPVALFFAEPRRKKRAIVNKILVFQMVERA